jgi:hypothetical protein
MFIRLADVLKFLALMSVGLPVFPEQLNISNPMHPTPVDTKLVKLGVAVGEGSQTMADGVIERSPCANSGAVPLIDNDSALTEKFHEVTSVVVNVHMSQFVVIEPVTSLPPMLKNTS